jgi:hypothetical protein
MGVDVAGYAGAAARLVARPLTVEVADAPGSDLHRAALRVADHEKVVVPDASLDGGDDDGPIARVSLHGETALADSPAALQRRVAELN